MEITKNDNSIKGAIIYLRVSTEEQVDNFSLETQEKICRQEAERRNMEVVQIFKEEGRSAKELDALLKEQTSLIRELNDLIPQERRIP